MNYEFEIKELEPITVATMQYKGKYKEAAKYFPTIFKAIKGKSCGIPFCCYYDMDEHKQTAHVELCVPTEEKPNTSGITIKELPHIRAVCTTHIGSYDTLFNAYKALNNYLIENSLRGELTCRETYIKGPGMFFKGNPKNYITEIAIPLVQENE